MAAVAASYYPVIHDGFTGYDDAGYITDNENVKNGLSWDTVKWAFTTYDDANWHPLTWLSHAFDCQLFGINPVGHHVMNVLFHAINAVLLFLLLQYATGFRWRSLMVAALFALHPINVESVAWPSERKTVLSTLFFLLAFYAYVWYTRKESVRRYSAVVGLYALALMAKPQVITFPFLLLLWDYWPLHRISVVDDSHGSARGRSRLQIQSERVIWDKLPLFLLSAVSALLTMQAQNAAGAVRDLSHYSVKLRVETATVAYVRYIGHMFWPSKLVALYPHPLSYPAWQVISAALVLVAITALAIRVRDRRYLAAGWFWYLGSLVPMIGLVQVGDQEMADRYAYISFIGLFVMIVWLAADWASSLQVDERRISPRWLAVPAFCCLLALSILTWRQVPYWHDGETFWRRTLALTKDNAIAHRALAGILHNQGKIDEALSHVRAALAITPQDSVSNLLLADYDRTGGNLTSAITRYQSVAVSTANPGARSRAYAGLGTVYKQMGEPAKAKQAFESSLHIAPQPYVMIELGMIAQRDGNLKSAAQQYARSVAMHPTDVGFILLARTLQLEGRDDEALAMLQRAAKLTTNLEESEKKAAAMLAGR
jgi:protein O-mannosyl-transferase